MAAFDPKRTFGGSGAFKTAGEPPAGIFRPTGPDQAFEVQLSGIAAGLDLDWTHALPAQAAHMGPEASQEGRTSSSVQRLFRHDVPTLARGAGNAVRPDGA